MSYNRNCLVKSLVSNSEAGYTQPYGTYIAGMNEGCVIANSSFGATTGHTNGDIVSTVIVHSQTFHNCTFASAVELAISSWTKGGGYFSQKHNGVANSNKRVAWEGNRIMDSTIYNSASFSARLTPARSNVKLESLYWRGTVLSGNTLNTTVYVRKSSAGDGTAYNGNQPRLIVKANPVVGILSDTVLATASAAAGTWEQLSGTTAAVTENTRLEFYVDCDGTQGWINIDDVVIVNQTSGDFATWANGIPAIEGTADLSQFTDVPTSKVELSYTYKYNSPTDNRTGTRRQPAISDVHTGVVYGPSDTLTGTYDGSDRWTDPGDNNVRSGTTYKANSTTTNKTGRITVPIASEVKIGVAFETDAATTGTYNGSDRWTDPGDNNVRVGTAYKADSTTNNKTGRVTIPPAAKVLVTTFFDTDAATEGTFNGYTPAQIADAVWDEDLTTHTTADSAADVLKQANNNAGTAKTLILAE